MSLWWISQAVGSLTRRRPFSARADNRKPCDLPDFHRVNAGSGNVKTGLAGAYHTFDFGKHAERHLRAISYRFHRRFRLDTITERLLVAAVTTRPRLQD